MSESAGASTPGSDSPAPAVSTQPPAPTPAPSADPAMPSRPGPRGGRRGDRAPRPSVPPVRLADTAGPDPAAPPQQVRLTVGTIGGPFGTVGEVQMRLVTDDPERLPTLTRLYIGDEAKPYRLLGVRFHGGQALLHLQFVSTPEQAAALRGLPVRIAGRDARPLAEGEFVLYQLLGLDAYDEAGTRLGRVTDLLETGANDVLVVTPDEGPDLLFPNIPSVVLEIRPDANRITLRPLIFYGE